MVCCSETDPTLVRESQQTPSPCQLANPRQVKPLAPAPHGGQAPVAPSAGPAQAVLLGRPYVQESGKEPLKKLPTGGACSPRGGAVGRRRDPLGATEHQARLREDSRRLECQPPRGARKWRPGPKGKGGSSSSFVFRVSLRICPGLKRPLGRNGVGSDFPSNEGEPGGGGSKNSGELSIPSPSPTAPRQTQALTNKW